MLPPLGPVPDCHFAMVGHPPHPEPRTNFLDDLIFFRFRWLLGVLRYVQ